MSDRAIPACQEWLGIDPSDLSFPHRVVGVSDGEVDPLVIVRAADRRLAALRAMPAARGIERDALIAQVEAARDAMLTACVAPRPPRGGSPPPVPTASIQPPPVPAASIRPPPVPAAPTRPPPVPPAPVRETAPDVSFSAVVAPASRPPRAAGQSAAIGFSMFMLAVAGAALYVAWPQLQRSLQVARRSEPARPAAARPDPGPPVPPESNPPRRPAPRVEPSPDPAALPRPGRDPQPALRPEPDPTAPTSLQPAPPEPPHTATPRPAPPPAVDVAKVRRVVGSAIDRACAALRERDIPTAKHELDAVAGAALDDQQAADRLHAWRQLVVYAGEYPRYRDKALASAASTAATYDLGGRQIGVVEVTARHFIYRDSKNPGRNLRVPHDAIPADVETVLVKSWFAKDGRPANHLFLGAAAICRSVPDVAAARREWETAAAGGEEDAGPLLGVLDDPALRGE